MSDQQPQWEYFDRPATEVEDRISDMGGRADEAITAVKEIVRDLGALAFDPEPPAPVYELEPVDPFKPITVNAPINANLLGGVQQANIPPFDDLWGAIDVTGIDFDVAGFIPPALPVFPIAPLPIVTTGLPAAPYVNAVPVPDAPVLKMPELGDLAQIGIPSFVFPVLPLFDGTAPTFDAAPPSTLINWAEPVYASEVMTDLQASIRTMLAGGTGLPIAIQQALFDAARGREQMTALESKQEAFDAFAGRGFSMPPGMLVKAVEAAAEKSRLSQNDLQRDILAKSAVWEIENLRAAVEKGLAHETLLINQFNNATQRSFEMAKYRVEADINLFNALVTLFNARQSSYKTLADVFKIKTDAALAKLEVVKAQIQGAVASGQLNEQTVRVFTARVDALSKTTDLFRSRLEGVKAQTDIERMKIEAYGQSVSAWAKGIDGQKTAFDAYDTATRAEATKVQASEMSIKAFEATIRGQEARSNAKAKYAEARINALRGSVDKFRSLIEAEQLNTKSTLEAIQAKAAALSADTQRYSAEISGANTAREVDLRITEDRVRNNLAHYEVVQKAYDAKLSRILEQIKIKEAGLDAAARTTAAVAAGAMSAIHVQASMSGTADIGSHTSTVYNHNIQE